MVILPHLFALNHQNAIGIQNRGKDANALNFMFRSDRHTFHSLRIVFTVYVFSKTNFSIFDQVYK